MLLAEAQSLWPSATRSVRFEQHDPLADRQALREMALWCHRFSPIVAVDDAETPDCLLLDAMGLEPGAERVIAALEQRGYWAVAVVADTIGAAWAVAHYGMLKRGSRLLIVPCGRHLNALQPLPIEALRLPGDVVETLHELNIFRIDELLALPRADLPSRFGVEPTRCIDRALGWLPEMLTPVPPVEPLEASWDFEPPIADGRILIVVIEHLLERLLEQIALEHFGVQRLLCLLKLADRERLHFTVELLRPSASLRDLMELVKLKVERLRIPTEVLALTVRAANIAPLEFQQEEIFDGAELHGRKEVIGLLERLSSRLGEKAILRPRLEPDAQPEYAVRYEPWLTATRDTERAKPQAALRPIILKNRPLRIAAVSVHWDGSPQQLPWNGRQHTVERSWGPERIETGWWRGDDVRRDYYVVETTTGERFWVFQNLVDESWYLHGVFA